MILVTGGTGLVGSHLLMRLLEKGEEVRAIAREGTDRKAVRKVISYYHDNPENLLQKLTWVEADLLDYDAILEALQGIDIVYHCAALVSFNPADRKSLVRVNAGGTANLVNASLASNVSCFCHVSSVAALGRNGVQELVDENCWWTPSRYNSNYSISKFAAEREVWRAGEEGLNIVIVNPSVIIGPGNWHRGTGRLFSTAAKGFMFYTRGSSGFVDVLDVADAMIRLVEQKQYQQRFILSGETLSWKTFFETIHVHLNKPKPRIEAGRILSGLAWRAEKIRSAFLGRPPVITRESARSARSHFRYNNGRITNTTGFQFTPIAQTLERCCNIYKNEPVNKGAEETKTQLSS